ncbi:MAG TPA: lysophospholipid acyltransferase family protein [Levilinea sp.]|nr:lysophospholipid acyltransferase family protein [Levilinea sp.]
MKRETLKSILSFILSKVAKVEFEGLEHIPRQGGIIVATNHLSRLDIPVLFITPNRPDITALVADKYQSYPLFKFIVDTAGCIWIDRSKADFAAVRAALHVLKQGLALGISPEGTRSISGELLEGKSGTILIADRAKVPIVPVGLSGTNKVQPSLLRLRRQRVVARFGPAFTVPPIERDRREEQLKEYTTELMVRIAALLPPELRGFYADHPRLKEFCKGDS